MLPHKETFQFEIYDPYHKVVLFLTDSLYYRIYKHSGIKKWSTDGAVCSSRPLMKGTQAKGEMKVVREVTAPLAH